MAIGFEATCPPLFDSEGKVKLPGLYNHAMGTIFEELIRCFNEEAGEHWTPRDAVETDGAAHLPDRRGPDRVRDLPRVRRSLRYGRDADRRGSDAACGSSRTTGSKRSSPRTSGCWATESLPTGRARSSSSTRRSCSSRCGGTPALRTLACPRRTSAASATRSSPSRRPRTRGFRGLR